MNDVIPIDPRFRSLKEFREFMEHTKNDHRHQAADHSKLEEVEVLDEGRRGED